MKDKLARVLLVLLIIYNAGTAVIERNNKMQFYELIEKMARGETLTPVEQQDVVLQARRMQELSDLFASLITPGTKIVTVDGLKTINAEIDNAEITNATITDAKIASATAGTGGEVVIDDDGAFIKNSLSSWFNFGDVNNTRGLINIGATPSNALEFVNLASGGSVSIFLGTFADRDRVINIAGDAAGGYRLELADNTNNALLDFRVEGTASGSTFIRMRETSRTPDTPGSGDAGHIYIKGDKLIVQFNDGGTLRYKYLDLTGTGVTWVHSLTAP